MYTDCFVGGIVNSVCNNGRRMLEMDAISKGSRDWTLLIGYDSGVDLMVQRGGV